jgi:hypothetical protein
MVWPLWEKPMHWSLKMKFISIVYDDTPPLEKTCKVLMSLTQKRHKQ